jgi:hypothetical protein
MRTIHSSCFIHREPRCSPRPGTLTFRQACRTFLYRQPAGISQFLLRKHILGLVSAYGCVQNSGEIPAIVFRFLRYGSAIRATHRSLPYRCVTSLRPGGPILPVSVGDFAILLFTVSFAPGIILQIVHQNRTTHVILPSSFFISAC